MKSLYQWRDVLFPIVVVVAILVYRQISQMVKARRLREIAPFLNGEVVIRPFSAPKIRGSYMGMPFEVLFVPEGRASSGMLVVTYGYPCPFAMEVRQKGDLPRLGDLLLRGKAVQSGDEHFDEQFTLRVERDPDKAEHYVMNKVNQEMLRTVFQQGFVSVKYSEKGITLSKPGRYLQTGVSPEELTNHLTFASRLGERF